MRKIKHLVVIVLVLASSLYTVASDGDETPWYERGKVTGKVFANFHTMAIDEFGANSAFEVNRAYFGYKQTIDDKFSTTLLLDIYKDDELGKRTAFFKSAYLEYKQDRLKVQAGIAGNFQFKVQEKFFGYRYVVKSFQDKTKFGPSADLGIFAYYKASDALTVNFSVNNGEGYGDVQNTETNNFKTSVGLTITPGDVLTVGLYADSKSFSDSSQMTLSGFVGAKINPLSVGVEFVNQTNHKLVNDHDYMGLSVIGKVKASDKINLFARYDWLRSSELDDGTGEKVAWNLTSSGSLKGNNDGDYIIGGVEYIVTKNVRFALNYQHQMYALEGSDDASFVFLHMEAKF